MFRTVPLSTIRSFSLYIQQWYMSFRFSDSLRAGLGWNGVPSWSCSQAVSKPVWHIPLLCVQWKTPDDGQRNCPKHVEIQFKNKFEKLVHLVGFIIRNFITIHGHTNVEVIRTLPNIGSWVNYFKMLPSWFLVTSETTAPAGTNWSCKYLIHEIQPLFLTVLTSLFVCYSN